MWSRMARGVVSAARMTSSAVPRLRVLVAVQKSVSDPYNMLQCGSTRDQDHLTLVGTLLQLAVVRSLLHKVQQLLGESLIGQGPGYPKKKSLV